MCQMKSTFSYIFLGLITYVAAVNSQAQDPKCLLPMEPGPCRMRLERYYYNKQSNKCEIFQYSGCRGNDNKFGFLKTCEDACVRRPASEVTAPKGASVVGTTTKAPSIRTPTSTKKAANVNTNNQKLRATRT